VAVAVTALFLAGCATPGGAPYQAQLDDLFQRLGSTTSDEEAHQIETAILEVWDESGQPDVDALMTQGSDMMRRGNLYGALIIFDRVVERAPGFAEGYNHRALVHALRNEYPEALADIQHVLAIEPRHFGALVGLGQILLLYDLDEQALHAFQAALSVNPHLAAVRNRVERLQDKLAGTPI
jgi:tetratricopeptide (TPR) repeat protein